MSDLYEASKDDMERVADFSDKLSELAKEEAKSFIADERSPQSGTDILVNGYARSMATQLIALEDNFGAQGKLLELGKKGIELWYNQLRQQQTTT